MIRFIVALLAIFIPVEAMAADMTAFDMFMLNAWIILAIDSFVFLGLLAFARMRFVWTYLAVSLLFFAVFVYATREQIVDGLFIAGAYFCLTVLPLLAAFLLVRTRVFGCGQGGKKKLR